MAGRTDRAISAIDCGGLEKPSGHMDGGRRAWRVVPG